MSKEERDETIVYREHYENIRYNHKVKNRGDLAIVVASDGDFKELLPTDNGIINPSFHRLVKDPKEYTVIKIKNGFFDGRWGGNVQYVDARCDSIQEKVYIRLSYQFSLYSPERVARRLGAEEKKEYKVSDFKPLINNAISQTIKSSIARSLNSIGFIQTQGEMGRIAEEITQDLNEKALPPFGIEITGLRFELEEDPEHCKLRAEREQNKAK